MMIRTSSDPSSAVVAGRGMADELLRFRRLGYRQLILQTSITLPDAAGDAGLVERVSDCGCRGPVWRLCGSPDECLVVALLLDDPSQYAAGLCRGERDALFADLEALALRLDSWLGQHPGRQSAVEVV